jgi:hypothetical protein
MDDDRAVGTVEHADFEQVSGSVDPNERVCPNEHRKAVIEVVDQDLGG